MMLLAGVALAMVGSSLWMAVAPQLPGCATHRGALAWSTWCATRGAWLLAVLATSHGGLVWSALARLAALGAVRDGSAAALAAGAFDLPESGAWRIALVLAADLVAWRAIAAAEGDASEAAWNLLATPYALWIGVVLGAPRAALGALVALAWALGRRGRDGACGALAGVTAAVGGPFALAAALALVLAPGRRRARVLPALATGAFAWLALRAGAAPAWGWSWWPPTEPAGGLALARLVYAFAGVLPGPWTWLVAAVLVAAGFAWLARRGAEPPALAAWAFGACALGAPGLPVAALAPFAPLLAVWCADDPDRRGWWFVESLALPLVVVLELAVLPGGGHPGWRLAAMLAIGATALLALWPLRVLVTSTPAAPRH